MAKASVVNTHETSAQIFRTDAKLDLKVFTTVTQSSYVEIVGRQRVITRCLQASYPVKAADATKNRDPVSDRTEQKLRTHV